MKIHNWIWLQQTQWAKHTRTATSKLSEVQSSHNWARTDFQHRLEPEPKYKTRSLPVRQNRWIYSKFPFDVQLRTASCELRIAKTTNALFIRSEISYLVRGTETGTFDSVHPIWSLIAFCTSSLWRCFFNSVKLWLFEYIFWKKYWITCSPILKFTPTIFVCRKMFHTFLLHTFTVHSNWIWHYKFFDLVLILLRHYYAHRV